MRKRHASDSDYYYYENSKSKPCSSLNKGEKSWPKIIGFDKIRKVRHVVSSYFFSGGKGALTLHIA